MRKILFIICIILILSGCVNEVNIYNEVSPDSTMEYESENMSENVTQETTEKTEGRTEYFDIDVLADETPENRIYSVEKIELPRNAEMGASFFYDKYIFYSYYYSDYKTKQSIDDEDEIENEYGARLLMYTTDTGESRVIHSIFDTDAIILNIEYNGRYLMWSEFTESERRTRVMDMKTGEYEFVIPELEIGTIDVKLTDKYIFWNSNENNQMKYYEYSLYRYDFETKETLELTKNDMHNAFFSIEASQEVITICEHNGKSTFIKGYDFDGRLKYNYENKGYLLDAYCNSYGVVWLRNTEVFFYDAKSGKIYNLGYADSVTLIADCIITSKGYDGIYSYKIGNDTQKCIVKGEKKYVSSLDVTLNGDVYGKWIIPMQTIQSNSEDVIMLKVSQKIKLN